MNAVEFLSAYLGFAPSVARSHLYTCGPCTRVHSEERCSDCLTDSTADYTDQNFSDHKDCKSCLSGPIVNRASLPTNPACFSSSSHCQISPTAARPNHHTMSNLDQWSTKQETLTWTILVISGGIVEVTSKMMVSWKMQTTLEMELTTFSGVSRQIGAEMVLMRVEATICLMFSKKLPALERKL